MGLPLDISSFQNRNGDLEIMKNTTIHIALVSSDEYMKYTAVVMLSVLQHLPTKQSIFFHILTEDITDNSKNKIIKMKNKYNFDVEYIYRCPI